jgi:paired amphipathic helix protein Sin3a
VTSLFSAAPDLLEDFKQFLPESAAQHRAQQQAARNAAEDAAMLSSVRGESGYGQIQNQQTPRADTSRLPPMGNFAPTPTANRDNKRKRGERQGPGGAVGVMATTMQQEIPTSNMRGNYTQGNMNKVSQSSVDGSSLRGEVP